MHRACYRHCQRSMRKRLWLGLAMFGTMLAYGQSGAPSRAGTKILVPALVESKAGEVAYGLSVDNFSIKDDGIEQQVDLESDPGAQPLSLLLVIQTGHNAAAQLGNIARLDDLLDSILTSPRDQVGIITFDGRPRLVQDFTTDSEATSKSLSAIEPGNANSALFDAIHLAVAALRKTSSSSRRVILLISGEHDHGSNASDTASLIRDVSSSDSSIYSLSFRADRKELIGKLWSLNPLAMTTRSLQRNAAEGLAQLTGGDFYRFDSEKSFEDKVSVAASHIHNRYSLTFRPTSPQPGFHSLQVEVRHVKANVVSARSGYWLSAPNASGGGGGFQ
jgi:VWFA-related protein